MNSSVHGAFLISPVSLKRDEIGLILLLEEEDDEGSEF